MMTERANALLDDAVRVHGVGDRFDTLEWSRCS